ncbi:hypothetical protein GCM10010317_097540 [Streptomyces mirabilis]|nr:hypothetical protein GCM10010317_097540 [Streptomyces mirabilis]
MTARPPSPRAVAKWILRHPESPTESEQVQLKTARTHCPELAALTHHVRSFAAMLTSRQGEHLPDWLDGVRQDDLPSLHTLAAGIDRGRDAVIAGLTLPWNYRVVEGHINRIKMAERQIFGRAGFDLLRERVLPAPQSLCRCLVRGSRRSYARRSAWAPGTSVLSTTTQLRTSPTLSTTPNPRHAKP